MLFVLPKDGTRPAESFDVEAIFPEPLDEVSLAGGRKNTMSLLVISAMAAATFAAVHPSLGSEPAMVNFDDSAPPAVQITIAGGTLADSLGSEPMLASYDAAQPTAPKEAAASIGFTVTLADSLGSEPMFFEVPAAVPATAGPLEKRPHDEKLACACCN